MNNENKKARIEILCKNIDVELIKDYLEKHFDNAIISVIYNYNTSPLPFLTNKQLEEE